MTKDSEELVQASFELAHAMDFLDDPVFLLDLNDRIIAGNKAFFNKIGADKEDAIGVDVKQYFHPEGEAVPCPVCQARIDRRDAVITMEAEDPKNHTGKPMELEVKVVRNDKGEPVGVVQRLHDLTADREEKDALGRIEDRLRMMTSQTPTILWTTDTELRFTSTQGAGLKKLGLEQDQLVGMSLYEYFQTDDATVPIIAASLEAFKGESGSYEMGWEDSVYQIHVEPTRDARGEVNGTIGIALDVTEQKKGELKFRELLESAPDATVIADHQGKIVLVNSQAEKLFGYSRENMMGQFVEMLVPQSDRTNHVKYREGYGKKPAIRPMGNRDILKAMRADGTEIPVEISLNPLHTEAGLYITAVIRDVSQRLKEESDLARLASFPELNPLPILEIDLDGNPTYMNPTSVDLFPDLPEKKLKHPYLQGVEQYIEIGRKYGDAILRDVDLGDRVYEQKISYIPESKLIRVYAWDITNMREMTRKLTYQATHDPLTSLINREEFERRLEQEVQTAMFENREHVLCYLDLDQFKIINDTCGHMAGDSLLRQLTDELRSNLRSSDTLGRLGGDEFGLLLIGCPLERGVKIAETLRKIVAGFSFSWEGKAFRIGVSIGVVPITKESGTAGDVMSAADAACYVAKNQGRNRVHVGHPEDSALIQHTSEMNWTHRIQHALETDRMTLFCQQIRSLNSSEPGYYEVLVRMLDDDGSIVPPMAFIPAAERYNLMSQVDRWVVRRAFSLMKTCSDDSLRLAINLSGHSLSDMLVLQFIIDELEATAVDPERVTFEITETAVVANLDSARRFISTLKGQGCRFALDDFGSGLSSFAYLKTLPVDYLKIDGGIVKGMAEDPVSLAMVESINHVGHVMGIKTIAEFVENEATCDQLKALGVDYGQGFGIHKPEPMVELLSTSAPRKTV